MNIETLINELSALSSFINGAQSRNIVDEAIKRLEESRELLMGSVKMLERFDTRREMIPSNVFGEGDPGLIAKSIRRYLNGQ